MDSRGAAPGRHDRDVVALLRNLSDHTEGQLDDPALVRSGVMSTLADGVGAERAILWSIDSARGIAVSVADSRAPRSDDAVGPDDHHQLSSEQLRTLSAFPRRCGVRDVLTAGLKAADLAEIVASTDGNEPAAAAAVLDVGGSPVAVLLVIEPDASRSDDDLDDILTITIRHAVSHLQHLRAELKLARRLDLDRLSRSLADQMLATPLDALDVALDESIGRIAEFVRLDAAMLWRLNDRTFNYVAGWDSRGVVPTHRSFEISAERAHMAATMTEPIPLAIAELNHAEEFGYAGFLDGSMLSIPVSAGHRGGTHLLSFVRFDSLYWSSEVKELLTTAMSIFSQTLSRMTAEQLFSIAFDTAPAGMTIRDTDLRLIACNSAYEDFVGRSEADLVGSTVTDWVEEEEVAVVTAGSETGEIRDRSLLYEFDDGRSVWGRVRQRHVVTADGSELVVSHVSDVTAERQARNELEHQATHDALTGLPNRRALDARLDSASDECAVLLLDLDRFKVVNDSLGHGCGDDLLVAVADRLRLGVRPNDLVVRLGGDEFAVLMTGPVSEMEATVVAERILHALSAPVRLGDYEVYPGASIGVAAAAKDVETRDLMRRADTAMYAAKSAGRNRLEVFTDEMGHAADERLRLDTELRGAVDRQEFRLHFQPEVDLETGDQIGAEALVRWEHPTEGLLLPGDFIPRAEETGVISEIGDWVLDEACAQMARWTGALRDGPQQVRVNISAVQLLAPTMVERVAQALSTTGLTPDQLCLEITESVLMANVALSLRKLTALKDLGVSLAIDDFGTGFSSLAYLQRFPVDVLKIDRSFVGALSPTDDTSRAIVTSILQLADAFDMDVVAEGIETEQQAAILTALGCRRAQGFLFARPAPAEELTNFTTQA